MLAAVRQRQARTSQRLLQHWVHRHGLSALNDLCIELMQEQGEEALHWFLELMAQEPSLGPAAGRHPARADDGGVTAMGTAPHQDGGLPGGAMAVATAHHHSHDPIAAVLPPVEPPLAVSAPAEAPIPTVTAVATALAAEASPTDPQEWQSRAQAAVNDAFAALAESFPDVLPPTTLVTSAERTAEGTPAIATPGVETPTVAKATVALATVAMPDVAHEGVAKTSVGPTTTVPTTGAATVAATEPTTTETPTVVATASGPSTALDLQPAATPQETGQVPGPLEAPAAGVNAAPPAPPRGQEPGDGAPPPLPVRTIETAAPAPAPPLPQAIPYPPSPIFPAAPGARLGGPAPQPPRTGLITAPPPLLSSSTTAPAPEGPLTTGEVPAAAGLPATTPPQPGSVASSQADTATPPSTEVWTPSLLDAPGTPETAAAETPDSVEADSLAVPSLQALQQGFGQLGGRLARQGRTRLTHLRALMRDCVEETVSLLRNPPVEAQPPAPPPATTSPSLQSSASLARATGSAAPAAAPLPTPEDGIAARRPRTAGVPSDRARLKRAAVRSELPARSELPGGRRAPAPSALSDLRAWLPDTSEDRRVS